MVGGGAGRRTAFVMGLEWSWSMDLLQGLSGSTTPSDCGTGGFGVCVREGGDPRRDGCKVGLENGRVVVKRMHVGEAGEPHPPPYLANKGKHVPVKTQFPFWCPNRQCGAPLE